MRLLARLGLLLAALGLVAGAGELLVRWLEPEQPSIASWQTAWLHRPDPELVFSLRPGAESDYRTGEFVERSRINRDGMRDRETRQLGPGEQRVLVLGDSMTFGHGVDAGDSYPNQLEALFARQGRAVDVVNAGVRGYGTDHAYRWFKTRLRGLEPDLVVLGFYVNDISDDIDRPLYRLEGETLVPLDATADRVYRIGRLYELLPRIARRSQLLGWLIPRIAGIGARPEAPLVRRPEHIRPARERFLHQLGDLQEIALEDGFRLLLLAVPYRDRERDEYLWLHRADLHGVPLLDPSRRPEWEGPGLFFARDDHLTREGHRLLAEQLHRAIDEQGLLVD